MEPNNWHKIREVLELALELPREDRAGFLDERCAGDDILRSEVESLLDAHARGGTLLERPAVDLVRGRHRGMSVDAFLEAVDEPEAGWVLGGYRISKQLDEGGMGTVYLAHRAGEEDPVAIKVAKVGLPPRTRRRLLNEARILADLDHPSIARVLGAGTTGDGRPYFVMDFIRGLPIDEYCEERALSVEQRLELFVQVCSAVEVAHRQGVVHRDVKPSNVLVTAEGRPKLLDFGIAKLLDPEAADFTVDATRTGERFLTPKYASPEQIRGEEITPRSDVYSLGALLYKLLTDRLPYVLERYTAGAMERAFENQAPPWPSEAVASSRALTSHTHVGSDLDFIVMKAICLEPDNRYPSVESFADDLERYLEGRPPALEKVHRSEVLRSFLERPRRDGTIRPLRQIPPPPADFTGRESELAVLAEAVEKGGVTISALQGMGGVGKTALALKLAEELAAHYPDAQIYLDLKGVSREPLTPAQAMAHVIHSYHPRAPLPETEAGVAGFYRSVLHGRRALLLMDNASGLEQVEPLVPPRGCGLLVTSRRSFALPGLHVKRLDSLPLEDAVALLRRIVPHIGEEAGEIADLCGYLPIALRLAGATLAERRDLSPAAYARRLKEGRGRLELVEASLSLSCELLDEERQGLWRALAVFPGTFDLAAAAAIWDLDPDRAEGHLGELVKNGLVDGVDGRYRLHDLARYFGEHRLSESEHSALHHRHARYYLEVLRTAEGLYMEGGENIESSLRILDTEWTNIRAGQAWSQTHFRDSSSIARLCCDYPRAGSNCLVMRLSAPTTIHWREYALEGARRLADRQAQGQHLACLGLASAYSGHPHRGIEFCEQALKVIREIGDRRSEGHCLGHLGVATWFLGDLRLAIKQIGQAHYIARQIGDRRLEGICLGNLGGAYLGIGQTRRGIDLLEQGLFIHREVGNRYHEGICLCNLGWAYRTLGQVRQGVEILERSLHIMREIGHRRQGEGYCLDNLAGSLIQLSKHREALDSAVEAHSIALEVGDKRLEGMASASLGMAYLGLGETRRGIELTERSLALVRKTGASHDEAYTSWHLGLHYEKAGELERAAELMQVRVNYERSIGHTEAELHAARVEEIRARTSSHE